MVEKTDYLSVKRKNPVEVGLDLIHVATSEVAGEINQMSDMAVVFNSDRQVVFANETFMSFVGLVSLKSVITKRLGEILGCVNATLHSGGCGTSIKCRKCPIAQAFDNCLNGVSPQSGICLLTSESATVDELSLDFTMSQVSISDEFYYLVTIKSIDDC